MCMWRGDMCVCDVCVGEGGGAGMGVRACMRVCCNCLESCWSIFAFVTLCGYVVWMLLPCSWIGCCVLFVIFV